MKGTERKVKLYPFSGTKHAHDIDFRRSRVKNELYGVSDMKEYCRYMVIDIDTGMYLAVGEKFKDMTGLDCVCKFKDRRGTERFEVREYFDFKKVHGRSCLFLYWILPQKCGNGLYSCISFCGRLYGLRGTYVEARPQSWKSYDFGRICRLFLGKL